MMQNLCKICGISCDIIKIPPPPTRTVCIASFLDKNTHTPKSSKKIIIRQTDENIFEYFLDTLTAFGNVGSKLQNSVRFQSVYPSGVWRFIPGLNPGASYLGCGFPICLLHFKRPVSKPDLITKPFRFQFGNRVSWLGEIRFESVSTHRLVMGSFF